MRHTFNTSTCLLFLCLGSGWMSCQAQTGPPRTEDTDSQASQPAHEAFIRGDADGDGAVTFSDAVFLMEVLFAHRHTDCPDALDANDNGMVDITDCIDLIFFLSYPETGLPPPFTETGRDPTQDGLSCYLP